MTTPTKRSHFKRFSLRGFVRREIGELATDLDAEITELRTAFARRSAKYRGSDAGTEVEAWIERLERLAHDLEAISDEPENQ